MLFVTNDSFPMSGTLKSQVRLNYPSERHRVPRGKKYLGNTSVSFTGEETRSTKMREALVVPNNQ